MGIKKQTFFKGVLIIMLAQVLIKILGFVYRIVLTNVEGFSDLGNSFYGSGYSVYAFILAIATMGIPNTISKLVSEKFAIGDKAGAHRIFKTAMLLFTFIGVIFSLGLFFCAEYISTSILNNPGVKYTLMALSPAIIFVAMTSVMRGYFVGQSNMSEHSKAQVIEQFINSVFSVVFVVMLIGKSPEIMAAGSTLATALATATAFFYLLNYYNKNKKYIWEDIRNSKQYAIESKKKIVKNLLKYVVPISFGSVIVTLSSLIDTITVVDCLQKFGYTLEKANIVYGILVGKVEILNSLPLAINIAFSVALVPFVSSAIARNNKKEAIDKINYSVKLSSMIALPSAVGLSMLAPYIFNFLFPMANTGAELLRIQAFMVVFSVIAQTLYGALQGLGKLYIPGMCLAIGIVIKYLLNIIFIPIYGEIVAPISSVIYQIIACSLAFIMVYKYLKQKPNLIKLFLPTILATLLMAASIVICTYLLPKIIVSNTILTVTTIIVAIITYVVGIFMYKGLNKEEILELPMGEKMYNVIKKIKLI